MERTSKWILLVVGVVGVDLGHFRHWAALVQHLSRTHKRHAHFGDWVAMKATQNSSRNTFLLSGADV